MKWTTKFIEILSLLVLISLATGFFIWNIYLVKLGFYEFDIIQTRYIHTGFIFLIFTSTLIEIILAVIWELLILLKKLMLFLKFEFVKNIHFNPKNLIWFGIFIFVCFIPIYSLRIFPFVSQAFGGAQPRLLSIIGSESEIDFLANFGIVKSSPVITQNLCIAYENQDLVVILLDNKILAVKKDNFKGFNSLPAKTRDELLNICSNRAEGWILNEAEWNK